MTALQMAVGAAERFVAYAPDWHNHGTLDLSWARYSWGTWTVQVTEHLGVVVYDREVVPV